MKTSTIIWWVLGIVIALTFFGIFVKTCNTVAKYNNDAQNTIFDQTKLSELLRKYEWFKDAAAQLDSKKATLGTYESRFVNMKQSYGADSLTRRNWLRSDVEQWNVWESEYTGIKASYNDLASQYNSAMAKINYRFCNVGDLPKGADVVLPREFKAYITN